MLIKIARTYDNSNRAELVFLFYIDKKKIRNSYENCIGDSAEKENLSKKTHKKESILSSKYNCDFLFIWIN